MPDLLPPNVEMPPQRAGDVRLGHLIGMGLGDNTRVALIGFPSDAGVRRNGGRVGAALGPERIRHHLYRLTPPPGSDAAPGNEASQFEALMRTAVDLGDVTCTGDVEADQMLLGETVGQLLSADPQVVPIVLGGGHETSFGHFLGYANTHQNVSIVNLDAHADVRPLEAGQPHSGSPFRQAVEHESKCCSRYTVAGLNPHSAAPEHAAWIKSQGGQAYFHNEVSADLMGRLYTDQPDGVLATFDLDAVDQSQAPGVSAPNACGLSKRLWLEAAHAAGRSPKVRSMDIAELSPPHDNDDHTARLAALTVWMFLLGLSQRG